MTSLKPYSTLCRVPISLFAACSAAAGFFLAPHRPSVEVLVPAAAVFLLACGASALNQYQERDIDARMERTKRRPLPAGIISPVHALSIAITLVLAGLLALAFSGGLTAAGLGVLALLWYNGVYTYLKRTTAFASVPGAAVGMVPPAIGWVSAGGQLLDARLAAVCFIFFLWQVPHFWLLLLHHGKEYENAGLPSLTGIMGRQQISRITFIWICAASVASLALPLYGSMRSPLLSWTLIPLAAWLIWSSSALAGREPATAPSSPLFRKINIYLFLLMSLLVLGSLLQGVL
jgi:protoheme IX farnesyltransferase